MKTQELPPTLRLVKTVWDHHDSRSWDALNAALWSAYRLAIESGFQTSREELENAEWDRMRYDRWRRPLVECYGIAIACGNTSYIKAVEDLWGESGWKPVIADDVCLGSRSETAHVKAHSLGTCRLHLGASITIRGEQLTVTSRSDRGWNVVSHKPETGSRRVVAKRFELTPEFVQRDRAERKAKAVLEAEIASSSVANQYEFMSRITSPSDWKKSSIDELRATWRDTQAAVESRSTKSRKGKAK